MDLTGKIADLLEEKFKTEPFADCFIVDISLHQGNKLTVFLDCDSGLTLAQCSRLSRYLEAYLDEGIWKDKKYTLEVSSPGVDQPLRLPRQYLKNIGRTLKIKTAQGELKGTLTAADDRSVTIRTKVTRKEGKKKIREEIDTQIPFAEIHQAIVQISFNKKK